MLMNGTWADLKLKVHPIGGMHVLTVLQIQTPDAYDSSVCTWDILASFLDRKHIVHVLKYSPWSSMGIT